MFSAPVGYNGVLRHTADSLLRSRNKMMALIWNFRPTFSIRLIMCRPHGFTRTSRLYACPYPRMNPSTAIGLGRSFRQYRTDLTWDRNVACCVPDTDCDDCRHYAAGSAVVTARLHRHATDPTPSGVARLCGHVSGGMGHGISKGPRSRLIVQPRRQIGEYISNNLYRVGAGDIK